MEQENRALEREVREMKTQMVQVIQRLEEERIMRATQAQTDAKQNHLIQDLVHDVTKHTATPEITSQCLNPVYVYRILSC